MRTLKIVVVAVILTLGALALNHALTNPVYEIGFFNGFGGGGFGGGGASGLF